MTRLRHSDRQVNCPICGAAVRQMPKHPEAELFRCSSCSHAFSRPESIAEPETYGSSYYEEQHKRWFENPNVQLFASIAKRIRKGASVLDVGCGRGDFLRFIRTLRPDLQLTGIDLSGTSFGDGIRLLQGDILNTGINERFDVVVSLAVIEHISDVKRFIRRLRELTKPGGVVVAMTLNDSSLLYALARVGRHLHVPLAFDRLYSKHHLHHFTRRSLRTVFLREGFAILADFDHDAPIQAMDLPVRSHTADAVLRAGLRAVWKAAKVIRRGYLQTIVCTAPS